MKKISQFLMLLVTGSTLSYGAAVPVNTAKSVGYNFLAQNGAGVKSVDDLQQIYTSNGNGHEYFYVFGTGNCFVMVSADDAVTPILGYSTTNGFRADHMPSNLTDFLDNFNNQIEYAKTNNLTATDETAAEWKNVINNRKPAAAKTTAAVSPLLTTTWDQGVYYNALCPADAAATSSGGHDVTGCVATATAQVMRFWRWPNVGVSSSSYVSYTNGYSLSANFANSHYNWDLMPADVSSTNKYVAGLMADVGIGVDMDYTSESSGAFCTIMASPYTNCSEYALKTYFNYKPTLHGIKRSSYTSTTWTTTLEGELNAGRPVLVDGNGSAGGHNFVFDGYDASNKFHVNWGWSGASDGYYTISALNPPALGIGGGGGGFNSNQHAIIGVEPNGTPLTVAAPDMYEVNNTAATAYTLPLTWVSNNATKTTTGSNFHLSTDIDYYKIVLPTGYKYTISARVNDFVSNNDAPTTTYTGDAQWAYSLNNGSSWSSTYDSIMTGSGGIITVNNLTGTGDATVIFRVVQHIPGTTGSYVLKLSNIHRSTATAVNDIPFEAVKIFPNPATEQLNVDMTATGITGNTATLTDISGREVYSADVTNQKMISIPVQSLPAGMYILNVNTDDGAITRKVTVGTK